MSNKFRKEEILAGIILVSSVVFALVYLVFTNENATAGIASVLTSPVAYDVLLILTAVVLFLVFRAFVLWYWKIDRAMELLEKIEKNTRKD